MNPPNLNPAQPTPHRSCAALISTEIVVGVRGKKSAFAPKDHYRDCLIFGSQIRDDLVQIRYKVFEYEHPPKVNFLGGLVQVSTVIKTTSQDPQVAAADARRFQQRIEAGVNLVTSVIQGAIGQ